MRRTITTLMFLAAGGLAFVANAAEPSRSTNSTSSAGGQSSFRISDDDEETVSTPAKTSTNPASAVASKGAERNALYVPELSGTVGTGIAPTNYLNAGAGSACGCGPSACGCGQNACGCGSNGCGGGCLSDCYTDCSRNWFRFEYLMWFSRGRNTPPLVTSSPAGTPQADAGVIGAPLGTTEILYGNDPIGTDIRNGGRLTLSHLFADGITYGDVRFWGVEDSSETFAVTSANRPIIARPFFNAIPNIQANDAFLVAFPGLTAPGSIRVTAKNDLIGADAYVRRNLWDDECGSLDVLGGYQFSRLDDSLLISSSSTTVAVPGIPNGTVLDVTDSFRTQNEFHGASAGVLARSYRGAITLEALAKIAIGSMRQQVDVQGTRSFPAGTSGGLLALPSNIGTRDRNEFTFVPELNVNILYDLNDCWRVFGGYSFIYWNNVVLAGNQIDTNVNLTQLPPGPTVGPNVPAAKFQQTDFWVQGLNFGAEYRW